MQRELEEGQLILTFATTNDENKDSALHLAAGNTYYFEMHDITDASTNRCPATAANPNPQNPPRWRWKAG